MIRYLCPGYIALAAKAGTVCSNRVDVDLWCQWGAVNQAKVLASAGGPLSGSWTVRLTVNRSLLLNRPLYVTFFTEHDRPLARVEGVGREIPCVKGLIVDAIMDGVD